MLRLTEVSLFLAPFGLALAWWALGISGRRFAWAALALIALMSAVTIWFGLSQGLPRGAVYIPALLQGGRVIDGHGT